MGEDGMTRREAERDEAEELIGWAAEHAPALLPEADADRDEWCGVIEEIRQAKQAAAWRASRDAAGGQDSSTAGEPEPF